MLKERCSYTPNHPVPAWTAETLGFDLRTLRREKNSELVWTEQRWLEVDVGSAWTAAARLAVQNGRVVISELRVFPRDRPGSVPGLWSGEILGPMATVPAGGLTSTLLRKVPIPGYASFAAARIAHWRQAGGLPAESADLALPGVAPFGRKESTRRRAGKPDRFYAEVAAEYVRLLTKRSRRPVADLAKRRGLKPAQARDAIRTARERQLLSWGHWGKPDGYLTQRAEQLLGIRPRQIKPEARKGRIRGLGGRKK
jgi:hypothetical protein